MLIKTLRDSYPKAAVPFVPAKSVSSGTRRQPAANDGSIVKAEKQARRQRRQRRLNRNGTHYVGGWSVRTW